MLQLQELAKQEEHSKTITITDGLPSFLIGPCEVQAIYQVNAKDDYYLINLSVVADLTIICQRCLQEFKIAYNNPTVIAVCKTEDRAESLLDSYESIFSPNGQVLLEDLVRDELHLYVAQFHPDSNDCDQEVLQILT